MTIFELGFFVGLLVAILFASKWVGGLLGIGILKGLESALIAQGFG